MQKVVREGQVAVLVTRSHGGGWYTGGKPLAAVFHPRLVKLVEENREAEITTELMNELFGEPVTPRSHHIRRPPKLSVHWIPQGKRFEIVEYDGLECAEMEDDKEWIIA